MKDQSIWLGLRVNKLNGCGAYLKKTGWFKIKQPANNPNGFNWMRYMHIKETDKPHYVVDRFTTRLKEAGFYGSISCITDKDYAAGVPMTKAQWARTRIIL